jgi:hypothetical protein
MHPQKVGARTRGNLCTTFLSELFVGEREGHFGKLDNALDSAADNGWTSVPVSSDCKRVYPWDSGGQP